MLFLNSIATRSNDCFVVPIASSDSATCDSDDSRRSETTKISYYLLAFLKYIKYD